VVEHKIVPFKDHPTPSILYYNFIILNETILLNETIWDIECSAQKPINLLCTFYPPHFVDNYYSNCSATPIRRKSRGIRIGVII
jgi:hypothetical protein